MQLTSSTEIFTSVFLTALMTWWNMSICAHVCYYGLTQGLDLHQTYLNSISDQTWATPSALQNPWIPDRNTSSQKGRPTLLLSLSEWVVPLTAFGSQRRRGEFKGLNLNFRLFHSQPWTRGHVEDKNFRHASVFGVFCQLPQVLDPADSFCEGSLGAQLCWSSSQRWVLVSAL